MNEKKVLHSPMQSLQFQSCLLSHLHYYTHGLQVNFALKKYNGGKLHSHAWFFNGFARNIKPDVTVLVDVGTVPQKQVGKQRNSETHQANSQCRFIRLFTNLKSFRSTLS